LTKARRPRKGRGGDTLCGGTGDDVDRNLGGAETVTWLS
jgi:hypothetical protein